MNGLFIGFRYPVRGREDASIRVFNEHVEHFQGLQQRGDIDAFEVVFLEPHGGDLGGFFLIRGDTEKLAGVRVSSELQRLGARAQVTVDGYGVVGAAMGDEIGEQLGFFQQSLGELA